MKFENSWIGHIKDYKGLKNVFMKDLYLEEVDISSLDIFNDNIADTEHRDGKNKALFANPYHDHALWENLLEKELVCGIMGENLTLENLHEQNICISGIHQFESAILQVNEPHRPCVKISKIHQNPNFIQEISKTKLGGWYYYILESKKIRAHSKIGLIGKDPVNLSALEFNHLFYNSRQVLEQDPGSLEELNKLDTLTLQNWYEAI